MKEYRPHIQKMKTSCLPRRSNPRQQGFFRDYYSKQIAFLSRLLFFFLSASLLRRVALQRVFRVELRFIREKIRRDTGRTRALLDLSANNVENRIID